MSNADCVLLGMVPIGATFTIPNGATGKSKGPFIKVAEDRFTDIVGREWFAESLGTPATPVNIVQHNGS